MAVPYGAADDPDASPSLDAAAGADSPSFFSAGGPSLSFVATGPLSAACLLAASSAAVAFAEAETVSAGADGSSSFVSPSSIASSSLLSAGVEALASAGGCADVDDGPVDATLAGLSPSSIAMAEPSAGTLGAGDAPLLASEADAVAEDGAGAVAGEGWEGAFVAATDEGTGLDVGAGGAGEPAETEAEVGTSLPDCAVEV